MSDSTAAANMILGTDGAQKEPVATTEPTTETKKPVVDPNSAKWAVLAKREAKMREQIKAFEAKETAFKTKEGEYTSALGLKDRLLKEPIQVLQELGLGWDKLTEAVLNQPSPEDQKLAELRKEIDSLKGQQTAAEKRAED